MRLLVFLFLLGIQQDDFLTFRNSFLDFRLDENGNYLTRNLSGLSPSQLPEKFDDIPNTLSLKYLLDSDSSKLKYKYIAYNYDTDEAKELNIDYKHFAVGKFQHKKFDLLIYSRFDTESENFILRSFDKFGKFIDEIYVNQANYEGGGVSLDKFRFSLISPDSLKVFTYDDAKNPDKANKKIPLVTKVVIEDYAIDSLGRFNKVAVDSMLLSKPLRVYTEFIHMPEGDDPARKYWTLW
jgi:hypothetical protein